MYYRLFTEEQVEQIKNITLYDIIVNSTKLDTDHIQRDVFTVSQGNCLMVLE